MAYGAYKVGSKDIIKRKSKQKESQNNNGILGAAGYLVGSALAGMGSIAEGVIDGTLAPLADLTGNHDYAEYVFKKNVVGDWHADITEEYNPTGIMSFMGDVAHGLGQSAWMFIPYAGKPLYMMGIMSQGISSAVQQTGDVGVKEAAYGLTSGAVEAGLEVAFSGAGKAAKTVGSAALKKSGKSAVKSAFGSATRKGLAKQVLSGAASEFMEEAASEIIDTGLQRVYQIDPNKELNWGDVLYSGAVGAVSGGISTGATSGAMAIGNRARGAKIIRNGNAQTVVNTANYVADRLAASGTEFKNAPEWVKTLRGEVDAYNALAAKGHQNSASAQTILGEMQASLYYAEMQAEHFKIQEAIQNLDEDKRAALAEYINQTYGKDVRKKDYTAEDIAKNTDDVAKQLAVMQFAGAYFNYDAALEDISADMAQESGIEGVVNKERAKAEAKEAAKAAADQKTDEAFAEAEAKAAESTSEAEDGEVKHDLADDVADIEASAKFVDDDIERIQKDIKKAVSGIKVDGKLYELTDKHVNNIAQGVRKYMRQGMSESDAIAMAVETRLRNIKSMGEESGVKHELGKATLEKIRGAVINSYRSGMQSGTAEDASKTAQEAQKAAEGTEAQRSAENVTEGKDDGKAAEKSSESKKTETKEPKVSEAKESLTDEQRAERAKKQAEKWIEWEKKTAPTAKELNTAREYVKGFDNLNNTRRLAIIRLIRSADGVKTDVVKGIANIMAVNPKTDLEFRFAEGIGNKGLTTTLGNKTVIIIDSKAKTTDALRGTIAHELVHYLETREGYKEFAKYVRSKAKAESVEEIKAKYTNHYRSVIKAEEAKKGGSEAEIAARVEEILAGEKYQTLIDEEITASLAGSALQNERFLKRYAERDRTLIQKAWSWVRNLASKLKKNKKETAEQKAEADAAIEVADKYAQMMNVLLQMPTVKEAQQGTKYSFSSIAYTFFGEEDMTVGEFTERDYKKTEGYKDYVEECLNNFRQSRGDSFNEAAARKEIEDGIAGIVRVAVAAKSAGYDIYDSAGQRTTRDSKQRLLFSSLEPNSDYFTSSDISTICDKRKNFTEIEAEINRIEAEKGVPREKRFFSDINNFFILHDILAKHGLTTACRQCYVESMRKNLGRMANAFIDLVTETDESNKKNKQLYNNKGEKKSGNAELRRRVRELMADEGLSDDFFTFEMLTGGESLAELRLQHPLLFEAYNSFYGQSKPKMPKSATPFRFGELTALLTDHNGKINQTLLNRINSTGGFRLQSYSDFQIKNYVDVLQVIFEAGTLGLNGHAYTKVPAFLDATEGTNLKRNISIFMYRDGDEWKIDRNDSFPWALDRIYEVVNADKSGDTGIIAVSQNEDMSAWIMANDQVGYGIPFHKSGTKMAVVRETVVKTPQGDVKGYLGIKDHTKYQSEVYAKGESKGKKVKAPINIYEFWDFNNTRMSRKNLIEKNVKKYIDECERLGYLPKFRDYVMNNEKVLNATLAYAKKLGYADANATVEDISFKYKGYTIPYGYYKFLVDFGVFTPEGKASPVKALSLKDYNFDKAVSFFSDSKKLRINELLQQIANGEERDKYRKLMDEGKMTIAELGKVIKDKRDAVVAEVVGETKYSLAGEDAETADKIKLKTAKAMIESGADSETVRRETGWFKGYDGKWRFEIDDSKAIWKLDTAKPDANRLFMFGERIFKLSDILDHPDLYEAYPQLRNVTVWENPNSPTTGYVVGRSTDSFTVRSLENREINKDFIIHEIQHLIQNIEGFASGASVDQFEYKAWGEKEYEAYEKRNEIASKLYAILRRHGVSITKNDVERVRREFEINDSILEDNYFLLASLADNNKRTDALRDEYYKQVQMLNLTTPSGQYHAVAGEVEAYDVQARRRYSEEQRKNTRPNIDREDVIFADGSGKSLSIISNLKDTNGISYGRAVFLDTKEFNGINPRNWWRVVEKNINDRIQKNGTAIMNIYDELGNMQLLEFAKPNERVNNHPVLGELYRTQDNISKLSVIHIDEIVDASTEDIPYYTQSSKNVWLDKNGWLHRYAYVVDALKNIIYEVHFDIAKTQDGRHILYSARGKIKRIGDADVSSLIFEGRDSRRTTDSDNSIHPNESVVNSSVKKDAEYLSAVKSGDMETAQRMVDEKAKNAMPNSKAKKANGEVIHLYHGTSKGGFTIFDTYQYFSKFGLFGNGAYLTESKTIAEQYTKKGKGDTPQVYTVFANIKNPIDMDASADIEKWNVALKKIGDDIFPTLHGEMTNEQAFKKMVEALEYEEVYSYDAAEIVRNVFEAMGYDGITHIGGGRVNQSDGTKHRVWIAFEPNQIKSADPVTYDDNGKVIPLSQRFNPEEPDIRYDLADEDAETDEKAEKVDVKSEEEIRAEELKAKKLIEAMFQDNVRIYSAAEFTRIFDRVKNIPLEQIGELLKGNAARIRGKDLGQIARDVQLAMYKASFDGDVGATEAIRKIAEKAASVYVSQQTVFDEETKRHISLNKYIEDPEALKSYEETLAEELFKEFANAGKSFSNYRDFAFMKNKLEGFKKKYFDYKDYTEYSKRASANASDLRKLADMQKRAAADEGIRNLAKAIGSTVNSHGAIRWTKIDAVLAQISDFYNVDNAKMFGNDVTKMTLTEYAQVFDKEARSKIDRLLELRKDRVGKPLTGAEMGLWADITGALRATINEYNGLYKDGKFFDRTKVASQLAGSIVEYFGFGKRAKYKNKFLEGLTKSGLSLKEWYFYSVISPQTLIEGLEGYSHDGVLKSFYQSIQSATELKDKMVAELIMPFDNFLDSKDNRWKDDKGISHSYRNKLVKKKINLFGTELYLGEAINAYGLCKREHAQAGLSEDGIKIYGEDGRQRMHIKEVDVELAKQELYNQFDETDKEYIKMVEKFFNETSTRIKRDADYEYLGYTNTIEGYYIPIIRDRFAQDRQTTDIRFSIRDVTTIYNEKFNQHITKNAKACEVINIQQLVSAHARGLADYANLYMPLKSFDRLYNSAVVLDDGRTTTIRELLNDVFPKSQDYFRDLFGDIQGIPRPTGGFDTIEKLGQKITSGFAPSVLSANPSVILSQTSSYISAAYDIDPKYLVKALAGIGPRMKEIGERADKFSKIILARSFEEGAIRAQTNVDKINKVGKFLGKGIEFTDRQICVLIFHAAEIQAESEGVGVVGTESNSKRAAEIADKTIQDTQAMSTPTERSAWMRSPNLLARTVTLFTSDPMKQLSHLYSNVAKYIAHKNRVKMGDTSYEADLKQDLKGIGRSSATIIVNSAYLAAIAWLIRLAFNTDEDEPEKELQNVLGDFVGNVIGIMPLVSDMYDLAIHDYSITPTSVDILNDTVTNTRDYLSWCVNAVSGKEISRKETFKTWKNFITTFATYFGLPINPILKTGSGIIRRFSPSTIYWYDSALSYNTYREDIDRAIDIGDEKLAQAALEMKYQEEATGTISDAEIAEILRLYQLKDENGNFRSEVLPSSIPSEITTRKQRDKFEKIYGEASGAVTKLINSLEYKNLTDEERIGAIKNTYKLYFNKAKTEVLGEKITSAQAYAMLLDDTSNLFLAQARKSSMKEYEDESGNTVTIRDQLSEYLKLLEVEDKERLVIEYALGYKSKENKAKIIAYINSLNLSDEAKKQIAERLGFKVKDGIVVEKTEE